MNKFLSEIAIFKNGKKRPMIAGNIPVFGGNNILGYTNDYNYENCIIVGRVGAYCGNVYYSERKCWVSDNAIVVLPRGKTNILFLYYLLKSLNLNAKKIGSSQPLLTQEILNSIECYVPDEITQVKIANILYTLDLKVKYNNLINDNLEQQAKTIFKKYFPNINSGSDVIGKMIIPKRGKNLLSKDAILGIVPVIAGGIEPSIYHNKANTVPPVLTISASGANAGYINLWNSAVWSSDSSFIDSSMTPNVYFWYILLKNRQQEIFDAQTGSAQPHIYPKHIAELKINIPSKETIEKFTFIVTPFFKLISKNLFENDKLSIMRNSILPKLMSGNIDINNIEI